MIFTNYKAKRIISYILLGLGVLLVLLFLPCWIWLLLVGLVLIVIGVYTLKSC